MRSFVSMIVCFHLLTMCTAQTGVAIGTDSVPNHPGAILQVNASNQGILIPRTVVDSIINPVHGLLIFDTSANGFMFYDVNQWVALLKATDVAFTFFYADRDGDEWGDPYSALYSPAAPAGYVTNALDCDDTNPDIHPDAVEICDGLDNNCDGMIDPQCYVIDWAQLISPSEIYMQPGSTPAIYGQVYVEGLTDMPGQGDNLSAQVGYGTIGSDPAQGGWTWEEADYHQDVGVNDQYQGVLMNVTSGNYDYAYRFSGDGEITWVYADLNGSEDGYSADSSGSLHVFAFVTIDWAILQFPPMIEMEPGNTPSIYGQVYVNGITESTGQGPGILAQVGFGVAGSDPALGGWIWVVASYNGDAGNNDEYVGILSVLATGTYHYAYRFSGDGGSTWVYADLTGTTDGYSPDDAGVLNVSVDVSWAILQFPPSIVMDPGTTPVIYGQVYGEGVTEPPGQGQGIRAQVGYGSVGSDPALGGWQWEEAVYNADSNNNDEYGGDLTVLVPGMYHYAYRFSGDGGSTWIYADLTGTADGYNPNDAGLLTVN